MTIHVPEYATGSLRKKFFGEDYLNERHPPPRTEELSPRANAVLGSTRTDVHPACTLVRDRVPSRLVVARFARAGPVDGRALRHRRRSSSASPAATRGASSPFRPKEATARPDPATNRSARTAAHPQEGRRDADSRPCASLRRERGHRPNSSASHISKRTNSG